MSVTGFIVSIVTFMSACAAYGSPLHERPQSPPDSADTIANTARESLDEDIVAHGSQARIKPEHTDSTWWKKILDGKFDMKEPPDNSPKFVKFCCDVYNWADLTFNSYDSAYVVGTGHRWKFRILNDNWVDTYAMNIDKKMPIRMMSNIYSNIGAYLQYMAVSVGYTWDIANLIGNNPIYHKKFEFGFNCARFNAEVYCQENTGGSYLRKFGRYKDGHIFKAEFPGLKLYTSGLDIYYFFNNRKYSQGAAYNFSKIQKKSQGSFLLGFSYANLDLSLDFRSLPEEVKPFLTVFDGKYVFHYDSYSLLFGYGFNWVITRDLLFNITAMPSVGLAHCYEDSLEGKGNMLSLNIAGRSSVTYNLGNLFFSMIAKINGHWYRSRRYSMFSSIENLSANIGIRF